MFCDHKKTKMKLTAFAYDCKGRHWQYFKMVRCCQKCGCAVK